MGVILLLIIGNEIINTLKFIFSKVFELRSCLFYINFAQSYLLAEQFQPQRNEHLLYLCEHLERQGKLEEMISYLDKMLQPERVNPFPSLAFLIEDRAYYNTSNHLIEWKNRIEKKSKEFSINLDSIKFDFK